MANDTYLTDDYVASLLAADAKSSSIKYSSVGLSAYAPSSKPPPNKPKPNTRFLRNIIRDTDNHNSALLAKEAAEARARLESLSGGARQRMVAPTDIRKRQLGDIKAILGGPVKRKREEEDTGRGSGKGDHSSRTGKSAKIRKVRDEEGGDRRKNRKDIDISAEMISHRRRESRRGEERGADEEVDRENRRPKDRRRKHQGDDSEEDRQSQRREHRRRRSTSEDRERTRDERKRYRDRDRSGSPREHRSKDSIYRDRDRSPRRSRKRSFSPPSEGEGKSSSKLDKHYSSHSKRHPSPDAESSDSDPLDSIIGPRPAHEKQPLRIRGRGAISLGSTSMDSRFQADYDPKSDVQLEDNLDKVGGEGEDWDQALEALRDRQKWKMQGANRLRDAGFSEEEVKKWERGGEKREEDVKWKGKGEGREWDRGKVVRGDGTVGFETGWGDSKMEGALGSSTDTDFGRLK
ncbi:uncharacterized protein EAE97_010643 [Botrytis byssoidea]|uniref:Pre-mRNA-splicing factor 38B n=1 Tax=Botrytis byssoidea TaxID=139641 RepID=A0A9P5HYS3_9HELO|nr:uncharacterized protein EAE97_010643 [Botrytis byssoidea]KAF7924692.1 hypothetical protein EAE97_010643 [Botrytis byssoidea]